MNVGGLWWIRHRDIHHEPLGRLPISLVEMKNISRHIRPAINSCDEVLFIII